ncbi:MAG: phosphoribosylglycinamide formyltransferase [Bacteroidales bacterium]|nr:phosphoribosylglycinamide formyltransferase [Bacteroidales bacterium]
MKRIVIFASGNGSNAQRIIEYFRGRNSARVVRIYCNNREAYVLKRAVQLKVPALLFDRNDFFHGSRVMNQLKQDMPHLIILAGFLWLIPESILSAFSGRIINIHPALLPGYGGKGMYGNRVHQAVLDAGDTESGITIHRVNEQYDAGEILFQAKCAVEPGDTPETLAARIHRLEYKYYPEIVERMLDEMG